MKLLPSIFICCCLGMACTDYSPKPSGYFRIETGQHIYQTYAENPVFSFEYSGKASIVRLNEEKNGVWFNIFYPEFQANIHCSYLPINAATFALTAEDSRELVYRHTVKADDIISQYLENSDKKVYGILYEIKGNVASPLQFTLTDSIRHFFRGAVYFNAIPNQDSIAPVLNFIKEDVIRLMDSFAFRAKSCGANAS